ncbi:reverse transcriptase domain-containing protein [Tanacetum coccineum]
MIRSVNNKRKWENNSRDDRVPQPSYKRVGHMTRDCKVPVAAIIQRTLVAKQGVAITCYECGNRGHVRSDCPKTKNQNRENQIWKGKACENSNFVKNKTYA